MICHSASIARSIYNSRSEAKSSRVLDADEKRPWLARPDTSFDLANWRGPLVEESPIGNRDYRGTDVAAVVQNNDGDALLQRRAFLISCVAEDEDRQ